MKNKSLIDLIIDPEFSNFEGDGRFTFEFRTPSEIEFCVTCKHKSGDKLNPDNYEIEQIHKYSNSADNGVESSLEEVQKNLKETGFTLRDIFVCELSKYRMPPGISKEALDFFIDRPNLSRQLPARFLLEDGTLVQESHFSGITAGIIAGQMLYWISPTGRSFYYPLNQKKVYKPI